MKTRLRKEARAIDENSVKKREEHQKELLRSRIREALARYTDSNAGDKEDNKTAIKEFECYRKDVFLPKEVKDLKVRHMLAQAASFCCFKRERKHNV